MKHEEITAQANEIFDNIVAGASNLAEANAMLVLFYIPDMSYDRAAIATVIRRLKLHYNQEQVFKNESITTTD